MTTRKEIFLLDTSVFITASNSYYAMDIVPSFWDDIIYCHNEKKVYSIDYVKDELDRKEDKLKSWIKEESSFSNTFFLTSKPRLLFDEYKKNY